jgi:hypothetical protein
LGRNNTATSDMALRREDQSLSTAASFNNAVKSGTTVFFGSAFFRHQFKRKGRVFGANVSYYGSGAESDINQASESEYYDEAGEFLSSELLKQYIDNQTNRGQFKANAMYMEPIGKKFFVQTFYNFSNRNESGDRQVFDVDGGLRTVNDSLSRTYDNQLQLNRVGSSLRYSHKGVNLSLGLGVQQFGINSTYASGASANITGQVDRSFVNWIPNLDFSMSPKRNQYLGASYSLAANEPSVRQLQPIVDNSNPVYISLGNQDLVPELQHSIRLNYHGYNPSSFTRFYLGANYSYYQNQFITEQTVDEYYVTTSKPTNHTGGTSWSLNTNYGFPIVKNRFTLNLGYSFNFGNSFAFVNSALNKTTNRSHSPSLRINLTPSDKFNLSANARIGISDTEYNINSSQNQQLLTQNYSLDATVGLPWKTFFSTEFDYRFYTNERFGQQQEIPLLNLSLYRLLWKEKFEVRASVYDVFNQNRGISQNAGANQVSETRTKVLARYAMLSLTYNIRGIDSKERRGRGIFFAH